MNKEDVEALHTKQPCCAEEQKFETEFAENFMAHYYSRHCLCALCILERSHDAESVAGKSGMTAALWAQKIRNRLMKTDECRSNPKCCRFDGLMQRCESCQRSHAEKLHLKLTLQKEKLALEEEPAPEFSIMNKVDFRVAIRENRKTRDTLLLATNQRLENLEKQLKDLKEKWETIPSRAYFELLAHQVVEEVGILSGVMKGVTEENKTKAHVIDSLVAQQEVFRLQMLLLEEAILTLPENDPIFHQAKGEFENLAKEL